MSLRIIKAGILDTIQDLGRHGFEHLGINPGGVMDRFSAQLCNAILGKTLDAPLLEIHFPSSQILFENNTLFCLTGADFGPEINGHPIPMDQPIAVRKNSILSFTQARKGMRCYLGIWQPMRLDKWMNSFSTHLRAGAGGWKGRPLLKGDQIELLDNLPPFPGLAEKDFILLPWKARDVVDLRNELEFLIGSEWWRLTAESREIFRNSWYQVTLDADRMGYRLAGNALTMVSDEQLITSAVSFGTVQLLPKGQLIILMAEHQTTGGYPRIAHIISAHLPILAQKGPNDVIRFSLTDLENAEKKMLRQQHYLEQMQSSARMHMETWLRR